MKELLCLLSIILGSVVLAKISHVRAGAKVELLRETQKVECFKVSSVSRKSPVTFYFVVATHQSPFTYRLQLTSHLLLTSCNLPVTFYFLVVTHQSPFTSSCNSPYTYTNSPQWKRKYLLYQYSLQCDYHNPTPALAIVPHHPLNVRICLQYWVSHFSILRVFCQLKVLTMR